MYAQTGKPQPFSDDDLQVEAHVVTRASKTKLKPSSAAAAESVTVPLLLAAQAEDAEAALEEGESSTSSEAEAGAKETEASMVSAAKETESLQAEILAKKGMLGLTSKSLRTVMALSALFTIDSFGGGR